MVVSLVSKVKSPFLHSLYLPGHGAGFRVTRRIAGLGARNFPARWGREVGDLTGSYVEAEVVLRDQAWARVDAWEGTSSASPYVAGGVRKPLTVM